MGPQLLYPVCAQNNMTVSNYEALICVWLWGKIAYAKILKYKKKIVEDTVEIRREKMRKRISKMIASMQSSKL